MKANANAEIERVKNVLLQETEAFRIRLKANTDKETEHLKRSLQRTALEHQVQFSKLHEKRAEIVAKLYELVVTAYWATRTYHQWMELAGGPTSGEQASSATEALHKAYRFFEINRIYLSDPLPDELDAFFERAKTLTFKAQYYESIPSKT